MWPCFIVSFWKLHLIDYVLARSMPCQCHAAHWRFLLSLCHLLAPKKFDLSSKSLNSFPLHQVCLICTRFFCSLKTSKPGWVKEWMNEWESESESEKEIISVNLQNDMLKWQGVCVIRWAKYKRAHTYARAHCALTLTLISMQYEHTQALTTKSDRFIHLASDPCKQTSKLVDELQSLENVLQMLCTHTHTLPFYMF